MIRRLYVHNFRCLENFELDLSGRSSTLLIGKNGAGKSTVRAVLELLQAIGKGANRIGTLVGRQDFPRGRADVPMRVTLEMDLHGAAFLYDLAFELPAGFKELRIAEERLSIDGQAVFTREQAQVVMTGPAAPQVRFLIDWHLVGLPLVNSYAYSDLVEAFKAWLGRMLILAPIPRLITGEAAGETLTPLPDCTNLGDWLGGLIGQYPTAGAAVSDALRVWLPDLKSFFRPTLGANARGLQLQFADATAALDLPFAALSDGEKCFFIGALVLAAAGQGECFCCWDEPDAHLSLPEVGQFILQLRRTGHLGAQLVATSHDPETIRGFSPENTLLLWRQGHLEPSRIRAVSELQYHGDLVGALLQDDLEP